MRFGMGRGRQMALNEVIIVNPSGKRKKSVKQEVSKKRSAKNMARRKLPEARLCVAAVHRHGARPRPVAARHLLVGTSTQVDNAPTQVACAPQVDDPPPQDYSSPQVSGTPPQHDPSPQDDPSPQVACSPQDYSPPQVDSPPQVAKAPHHSSPQDDPSPPRRTSSSPQERRPPSPRLPPPHRFPPPLVRWFPQVLFEERQQVRYGQHDRP